MCNFTDEEVNAMKTGGNGLAREIWLARWSPQKLPIPNPGDEAAILRFMKLVFVKQAFKSGEELPHTVPIEKIMGKEKLPPLEVGKPAQPAAKPGAKPEFEWEDDPFVTPPQQHAPAPNNRPGPAAPAPLLDPPLFRPVQLQPTQPVQQAPAPVQPSGGGLAGFDFGKPMQPTIPSAQPTPMQPQLGGFQPGGFGLQPQPMAPQFQPQPGMDMQAQMLAYQQQLYQQQMMIQQMLAAQGGGHPQVFPQPIPMQQPILPRSQPTQTAPDPFANLRNNLEKTDFGM